jgi:hypothetical protein
MDRRAVDELMHRIQPQPVDVVVAHPHQRVVAEEPPHLVAAPSSKFTASPHGVRCGRSDTARTCPCIVAHRPEVVVDHIQHHRQPAPMARIDKALQPIRAAVVLRHRKQRDAVVSPSAVARRTPPPASARHASCPARPDSPAARSRIERPFRVNVPTCISYITAPASGGACQRRRATQNAFWSYSREAHAPHSAAALRGSG